MRGGISEPEGSGPEGDRWIVEEGENEISVIVYGTLKNLLGPHHIGAVRGSAWPSGFEAAPEHLPGGEDYDYIGYGLFSDFVLIESQDASNAKWWNHKCGNSRK